MFTADLFVADISTMSEPSSPSSPLLGQAPRWLVQGSRKVGRAQNMFKMTALVVLCVVLGVTVSSLYKEDRIVRHRLLLTGVNDEHTTASGESARQPYHLPDYLDERPPTTNAGQAETTKGPSFYHKVTGKISNHITSLTNKLTYTNPNASEIPKSNSSSDAMLTELDTDETTSVPINFTFPPLIGKVTIVTGGPNTIYERALRTHVEHNILHNYAMQTLRQSILADVWSKPAYIMSVILRELAKPSHLRLRWIYWVDADTIIINPKVPLEAFLPPPTKEWEDVNLLVTNDWNGLNNGVFPIRVCAWSVELLASVLAFPVYRPDEELQFRDQSAMDTMLAEPRFKRHTVHVPQRWFNAYQGEINETIAPFQTRPGDLLVHFAGVGPREERMELWCQRAEEHHPEWEVEFQQTSIGMESAEFWREEGQRRTARKNEVISLREDWQKRRDAIIAAIDRWEADLQEYEKARIQERIDKVEKKMSAEQFDDDPTALETILANMKDVMAPLQRLIDEATRDLAKEARKQFYEAHKAIFNLDLEEAGLKDAEPELEKVEQSMKRLQRVLKIKFTDEDQLGEHVKNLTKSKELLREKISEIVMLDFQFPTDEDPEAKKEEQEQAEAKAGIDLDEAAIEVKEKEMAEGNKNAEEVVQESKLEEEGLAQGAEDTNADYGLLADLDDFTAAEVGLDNKDQWWKQEGQFGGAADFDDNGEYADVGNEEVEEDPITNAKAQQHDRPLYQHAYDVEPESPDFHAILEAYNETMITEAYTEEDGGR